MAVACAGEPVEPTPGSGTGGNVSVGGAGSGGQSTAGVATNGGSATVAGTNAVAGTGTSAGTSTGGMAGAGTSGGVGGGGASSAGTGGNLVSGGTGGAAPSGCSGVTAKFCDDFEAQAADMPPKGDFSLDGKAGSLLVDSSKAYSGTKALHIHSAKPAPTAFVNFSKQFPMNDFHGRLMMYMNVIPKAEIHWDVIDTTSSTGVHWEIGGMYGKYIFVVDPPDHGLTSAAFPTGKWFCLQWEFKYGNGADNTFLAKQDNAVLDKGMFTGPDSQGQKWNAGPWKTFSLGWTAYGQSDVDIDEWIDDLAFGDAPIPCPVK